MPNPSKEISSISGRGWCTELSPLKKKEKHIKDSLRGNLVLFEPHHMAVEYNIYKGSCCAAVPKPRRKFLSAFLQLILKEEVFERKNPTMADWAPILLGFVLFILLSPGLLFQVPGNARNLEFSSFTTNGKAIVVHTLIFFVVFTILILALGIRIYTG